MQFCIGNQSYLFKDEDENGGKGKRMAEDNEKKKKAEDDDPMANPGLAMRILMKIDPVVFFTIMRLARGVCSAVDAVTDALFGRTMAGGTREERAAAAADYERSAQLVRVLGRGAYSPVWSHQLDNYFWRHEAYVHPRWVLEHDNATLQGVTPTHAFFCVSDPATNVYETKFAPFLFIIQFFKAERLVIMPHASFHRLADEVGDPSRHLTLINMTARCGSTLLTQMLSRVPRVRVMSEPWAFAHLVKHRVAGRFSEAELEALVRSCVRLQCKPDVEPATGETTHILLKHTLFAAPLFPAMKRLFPAAPQIFNTRCLRPSLISYLKVSHALPRYFYHVEGKQFWADHMIFPLDDPAWWERKRRLVDGGGILRMGRTQSLAVHYSGGLQDYLRHKSDYAKVVLFEDVKRNAGREVEDVLGLMGLSLEHAPAALEALKTDSQMAMFGAMGAGRARMTAQEEREVEEMLEELGTEVRLDTSLEELKKMLL